MLVAGRNGCGGARTQGPGSGQVDGDRPSAPLAIATSLSLRPMSAKELADELGAPVGKVRYQLGRLRSAGLAELKEERQRRGVSERVDFVRAQPFTEAEIAQLTVSQREKAITAILKAVLNDTAKALRGRAGVERGLRDPPRRAGTASRRAGSGGCPDRGRREADRRLSGSRCSHEPLRSAVGLD
ncbi:MAG TPA: helix-turn-helix domain-containing protein [Solirubrobacterales bacterium]|nr:helix-turn-helix domain-containing protein [Solirubrobacterales bacterium]